MTTWKMPPKAKIYEALSAVADGRVHRKGANEAEVVSSGGDKTYRVRWSDDMGSMDSNDHASRWQGYTGYPIVAVLLALGKITFDSETAGLLAGVPWKRVNDESKRDYEKAVDHVLRDVEAQGGNRAAIVAQADRIYEQLAALKLERGARPGTTRQACSADPATREKEP